MTALSGRNQSVREQPLSPHLSVYKPIPTMVMSILHRITGVALYFSAPFIVSWIVAVASGPSLFKTANGFFCSLIGQFILFIYSWTLIHHMIGGIKHLIQDTGVALGRSVSTKVARLHIPTSIALTTLVWVLSDARITGFGL
ncbi:succinate dehydrogenase, cytochrome b556 subunit [Candidatus Endowatersipora endosymbiont of Watersipora subatra]|uniref:succinate dehydrogenase, cytochrome b556 subunit n=1 Tax=Candidatus Endowatersipora endosymbiont of Watersipora subatra TaxID=3077946 RepID=UPI00312C99CC